MGENHKKKNNASEDIHRALMSWYRHNGRHNLQWRCALTPDAVSNGVISGEADPMDQDPMDQVKRRSLREGVVKEFHMSQDNQEDGDSKDKCVVQKIGIDRVKRQERAQAYAVWVSELMLQQTTVSVVSKRFQDFLLQFFDVQELAKASLDEVMTAWAGLGYYARARNFHAAANIVVHKYGGVIPDTPQVLQKLPGIGHYTANAIAAIAYDYPTLGVDTNIRRVLSRFYGVDDDAHIWQKKVEDFLPAHLLGRDIQLAMIDLGARVCGVKVAQCVECPLSQWCYGYQQGNPFEFPRAKNRAKVRTCVGTVVVVLTDDEQYALMRTRHEGILMGTQEFLSHIAINPKMEPEIEPKDQVYGCDSEDNNQDKPLQEKSHQGSNQDEHLFNLLNSFTNEASSYSDPVRIGCVRHLLTHRKLILDIWLVGGVKHTKLPKDYRWVGVAHLDALPSPLTTLMRKVWSCVQQYQSQAQSQSQSLL